MTTYHYVELTCSEADLIIKLLDGKKYPLPIRDVKIRNSIINKMVASCEHYNNRHKKVID